ncbi:MULTISPECIES: hypothetical protein [Streptomyces]|uniref:hypothetical protein n=1 Tax=Streptomyces TaxID=1883 RepID=UPI0005EF66B3|nr:MULTISPECIES: hypothetical protein [unclassified Streptomyces]UJV38557.1 hypothetical protein CVT30_00350 [Streptomyces sp. AMCC400023]
MIRTLYALLFTLVVTAATLTPGQGAAPSVQLPGGRDDFVVAMGRLAPGTGNWTRLGTYHFDPSGTVTAQMYRWEQTRRPKPARVPVGATPDTRCAPGTRDKPGSRPCSVMTAAGFTGAAPEVRRGTFELRAGAGSIVHIAWTSRWKEEWSVEPRRGLASLTFRNSGAATHGYAYGSNAELSTRRAMSSVHAYPQDLPLDGWSWAGGDVTRMKKGNFGQSGYRACRNPSWCMTRYQPSSTACGCRETSIQYYLARVSAHDRRDTWWHWCTCLASAHGALCHGGNSHVKPLLQILDDDGEFRGWVGVEASFYPYDSEAAARPQHMLGVLRLIERA